MGWGVYKQPNGKYAIWSSIPTDFIWYDCTADDIREVYKEEFGNSGAITCEKQLEYADGTKQRPRIGEHPETFHTRMLLRDSQHGLHNEHDGPAGKDEDYDAWLAEMRDLIVQQKQQGAAR